MNEQVLKLLQNLAQILSAASYTVTGVEMASVQNERTQLGILISELTAGRLQVVPVVEDSASDAADNGGDGEPDPGADGASDEGSSPIGPVVADSD